MELIKKEISELEMNIRTHSTLRTHMPELKTIKDSFKYRRRIT